VWTTSGFALIWSAATGEAYFRELDSNGTPQGAIVQFAGGRGRIAGRPHLTWLGDGYVVLWTEAPDADSELSVSQANRSGALVGSISKWLGGPARFVSIGSESVALVRGDRGEPVLARFDASGALKSAQRVNGELDWQGLGELTHGSGKYAVSYIPSSADRVVLLQIQCP